MSDAIMQIETVLTAVLIAGAGLMLGLLYLAKVAKRVLRAIGEHRGDLLKLVGPTHSTPISDSDVVGDARSRPDTGAFGAILDDALERRAPAHLAALERTMAPLRVEMARNSAAISRLDGKIEILVGADAQMRARQAEHSSRLEVVEGSGDDS